jgi:hypothetical protein
MHGAKTMNYIEYTVKVYENGEKSWYLNDKLHREDGPAVECANGDKYWYLNGNPHREDGPAVEWNDGHKEWYKDGVLHREDGPAIEGVNGGKRWWIDGVEYSKAAFDAALATRKQTPSCEGKVVEIEGKKYRLTEVK